MVPTGHPGMPSQSCGAAARRHYRPRFSRAASERSVLTMAKEEDDARDV